MKIVGPTLLDEAIETMSDTGPSHVTLAHHKAVVRSWRGRVPPPVCNRLVDTSRGKSGHVARGVFEWIREEPAAQLSRANTSVCEASLSETERASSIDENPEQCHDHSQSPGCLRTVGQIQHVYRSRTRREEAERDRQAIGRQLERRKHASVPCKPASEPSPTMTKPLPDPHEHNEPANTTTGTCDTSTDSELEHLVAYNLVMNAAYRTHVLRAVRAELSAGRDVRIAVRNLNSVPLADVKLALQQLCTGSLLFCTRDQNVLPAVDRERGIVSLELLARHRSV